MNEYVWQSNLEAQVNTGKEDILRGYDPLREIYHWQLITLGSLMGVSIVSYSLSPATTSAFSLNSGGWFFYSYMALIILVLLTWVALLFWSHFRYRREKCRQAMLQLAAFEQNSLPLAPYQPAPLFWRALPLRIESHLQKSFKIWMLLGSLLVIAEFLMNYVVYNHIWGMVIVPGLSLFPVMAVTYIGLGVNLALQNHILRYYLLPCFLVDEHGITARYGRDTISMRWQDIRSFALVNATVTSPIRGKQAIALAKRHEAFEISDGENMICWQVIAPPRSHRLLQNGEMLLSPQDYTLFTQQLAALIVERTGLPLYDFRPPARKAKKRKV